MKTLAFVLFALLPLLACAEPVPAGHIEQIEGDARLYDSGQTMRAAKIGGVVNEGDSIVTGADGEVHLAMEDEGQIAVRPNTRLRIARYKAEGGSSDASVIALVQGALRSVTGWIGKYNPRGYAIRTPTATIGVRGTDHETMVVPEGSSEGEPGTYDKVNHGATLLSTARGQTEIRPDQAGFVGLSGKARPQLLKSVPAFFRPQRLDARFQNLHDTVRQRIDQRRNLRIETLKARRDALRSEGPGARREARQEARREHRERALDGHAPAMQERRERVERRGPAERQGVSAASAAEMRGKPARPESARLDAARPAGAEKAGQVETRRNQGREPRGRAESSHGGGHGGEHGR